MHNCIAKENAYNYILEDTVRNEEHINEPRNILLILYKKTCMCFKTTAMQ